MRQHTSDRRTVGQYLVEALEHCGVRHVFGIPGIHTLELYRGLERSRLRHVTGRHEQGLGFMADGYARVSETPAACFTISGPGVGNITTALAQAYGDSVPMLVIASSLPRSEKGRGRGALHESRHQCGIARAVLEDVHVIDEPEQLPAVLGRCFERFSSARPRPVYIEVPLDLLASDSGHLSLPDVHVHKAAVRVPEKVLDLLRKAHRPVIVAGGGAASAAHAIRSLARLLGAPVVMTVNGRGVLPHDDPLAVPCSPSLEAIRELIEGSDAVLALGTEWGPTDYDLYNTGQLAVPHTLIRVDIDAAQVTSDPNPTVAWRADTQTGVMALTCLDLGPHNHRAGEARARAARARVVETLNLSARLHVDVLNVIRDTLPEAVIVGDSTQLAYSGNLMYAAPAPRSWFNSATGFGTLGYALPAASGAALAANHRPVVCLIGDGGIQFTLGELAVPREAGAEVLILIWNNQGYGEIRAAMAAAGMRPIAVDVGPPDFSCLAAAYGYPYRKAQSLGELKRVVAGFAQNRHTTILEIVESEFSP